MNKVMKSRRRFAWAGVLGLVLSLAVVVGCGTAQNVSVGAGVDELVGEHVLMVEPQVVVCTNAEGVDPLKCLQVKEGPFRGNFRSTISGTPGYEGGRFNGATHVDGCAYTLRVNFSDRSEFTFVEQISRDCSAGQPGATIDLDAYLGEHVLNIDSRVADCTGVGPWRCLVIKDGLFEGFFYETILDVPGFADGLSGFTHTDGCSYSLRVSVERAFEGEVPQDASALKFTFLEQLNRSC